MANPLPSYHGNEPYVFVSYSHADGDTARGEIRWLQDQGFNVWWDEGISPGAAWRQELAQALRNCSAIIYLVTPNSVQSEQCIREIHFGLDEYQRPVLAVHLTKTQLPDVLGLSLSDRQAIMKHTLSPDDYDRKLSTVVADLLSVPAPQIKRAKTRAIRSKVSGVWPLLACIAITAAVTIALMSLWLRPTTDNVLPPVAAFAIDMPQGVTADLDLDHSFDISSDDQKIYFVGVEGSGNSKSRLYVRDLSSLKTVEVPGTESLPGEVLSAVFISPDDRELLLFYALLAQGQSKLKKIPAEGGEPKTVMQTSIPFGLRLHWAEPDRIFYRDEGVIYETDASMNSQKALVSVTDALNTISHPFYDPRTRMLYYVRADMENFTFRQSSFIEALSIDTGQASYLTEGAWPRTTSSGHLTFRRGGALAVAQLSEDGAAIVGDIIVSSEVADFHGTGFGLGFTVSNSGYLVYTPKGAIPENLFLWSNRQGATSTTGFRPQPVFTANLSPDQTTIAFSAGVNGSDLWLYSLENGLQSRATFTNDNIFSPVWSHDNSMLVYNRWEQNKPDIYRTFLNGESSVLYQPEVFAAASDFNSDNTLLLLSICTGIMSDCDIGILNVESETQPMLLGKEMFNEHSPVFSPQEKFIAYFSNEFGNNRIVIRPYPEFDRAFWQVPLEGCETFFWLQTDEVVAECSGDVLAISVDTSSTSPVLGQAQKLFTLEKGSHLTDVTDDGKRLLLMGTSDTNNNQLIVKTNWLARLLQANKTGK